MLQLAVSWQNITAQVDAVVSVAASALGGSVGNNEYFAVRNSFSPASATDAGGGLTLADVLNSLVQAPSDYTSAVIGADGTTLEAEGSFDLYAPGGGFGGGGGGGGWGGGDGGGGDGGGCNDPNDPDCDGDAGGDDDGGGDNGGDGDDN